MTDFQNFCIGVFWFGWIMLFFGVWILYGAGWALATTGTALMLASIYAYYETEKYNAPSQNPSAS